MLSIHAYQHSSCQKTKWIDYAPNMSELIEQFYTVPVLDMHAYTIKKHHNWQDNGQPALNVGGVIPLGLSCA